MPAAIFVIPYADLMFAIIRRTRAGQPIMVADRQHLHHRLLNIGHSYRQSVLLMYLWAALFSVTVVSLSLVRSPAVVFAAATLIAVLALLPATMPRLRPWRVRGPGKAPPASFATPQAGRCAAGRVPGSGSRPAPRLLSRVPPVRAPPVRGRPAAAPLPPPGHRPPRPPRGRSQPERRHPVTTHFPDTPGTPLTTPAPAPFPPAPYPAQDPFPGPGPRPEDGRPGALDRPDPVS